jgi:hypothetical protein
MNLILKNKIDKIVKEPLLTENDWKSFSPNKKELEKLQNSYLSTFKNESKQKE